MRVGRWVLAGAGLGAWAARRRWRDWGSTEAERWTVFPGDELVAGPATEATRAVSIRASADDVWRALESIGGEAARRRGYEVARQEVGRSLVLRPSPARHAPDAVWSFTIVPLGRWGCRLVSRARTARAAGRFGPLVGALAELADPMAMLTTRRMLLGIEARAERSARAVHPLPPLGGAEREGVAS